MSRTPLAAVATGLAILAIAGAELALDGANGVERARAATTTVAPPPRTLGHLMRARPEAVAPGTTVGEHDLFTDRVFANSATGFALANDDQAQYPVRTADAGQHWRIDGPQLHVDAADAPEGVGSVGLVGPRTYFAYGSSVVDVTTDAGRTWWETYLGELVVAVVPGPGNRLVAYVQQQLSNTSTSAATRQYVSTDGGRQWRYSTSLGAFDG
jgi:hypothetical protein